MEFDLRSLFGLHVHCTAVLIDWNHATPPPHLGSYTVRRRYWSAKIDDISLRPPDIGARALVNINFIWIYYIARLSQWGGFTILLVQINLPAFTALRGKAGGGVGTLWSQLERREVFHLFNDFEFYLPSWYFTIDARRTHFVTEVLENKKSDGLRKTPLFFIRIWNCVCIRRLMLVRVGVNLTICESGGTVDSV